ncbi:MAG TPA: outer membrane beta-barrel protein, partial [Puia sp.]|nr:outer membrane beta-barrel protein [Puia sp.]
MKTRLAFATLLLTLTAAHSYAQKSMEWGLKAGGNYFKVGGRSFDNTYNISFSGGAYADLNYTSKFSLQPELLFNQVLCKTSQGFTQIYSNLQPVGFQLVSLDYIALPVLLEYRPVPLVSVIIGPQYSYLIAQTQGLLRAETNENAFHHSELALVFGAELNMGKTKA